MKTSACLGPTPKDETERPKDVAEFLYKSTYYDAPEYDRCIRWDDLELAITWPVGIMQLLSAKDAAGVPFLDAEIFPASLSIGKA